MSKVELPFDNFKFSPHAVGRMMAGVKFALTENQEKTLLDYQARFRGEGRELTDKQKGVLGDLLAKKYEGIKLSSGGETYLDELYQDFALGRYDEIFTNQMEKGVLTEEDSAGIYTRVTGNLLVTNEKRVSNDFLIGTYDGIVKSDTVVDIKSSYKRKSFPITKTEKNVNKIYYWQLHSYMILTGLRKAQLAYILADTPTHLVDDELRKLDWNHNCFNQDSVVRPDPKSVGLVVQKICNHIFTEEGLFLFLQESRFDIDVRYFDGIFKVIPEDRRVKLFDWEYNEGDTSKMKQVVKIARDYLNRSFMAAGMNYDLEGFKKRKEIFESMFEEAESIAA